MPLKGEKGEHIWTVEWNTPKKKHLKSFSSTSVRIEPAATQPKKGILLIRPNRLSNLSFREWTLPKEKHARSQGLASSTDGNPWISAFGMRRNKQVTSRWLHSAVFALKSIKESGCYYCCRWGIHPQANSDCSESSRKSNKQLKVQNIPLSDNGGPKETRAITHHGYTKGCHQHEYQQRPIGQRGTSPSEYGNYQI